MLNGGYLKMIAYTEGGIVNKADPPSSVKVSVIIPVYQESDMLESLLKSLLLDPYRSKEIFVIIDKPTERSLNLAERMDDRVQFILNGHRVGKVHALNEAANRTTGEILLFLDSDIKLVKKDPKFLETIVNEMGDFDLLDIKKKVIRTTFTTRIVHYDYLCSNIAIWLFSKFLGKSLGFNGAAFAIKQQTFKRLGGFYRAVADDMDIGTRSYLNNCSFKYTENVEIATKAPSEWKEWYKQRKRWGLGTALWIRDYYKDLLKAMVNSPKFILPAIFLICPSLILLIINLLLPDILSYQFLMVLMLLAATQIGILLPPMLFAFVGITFVKNIVATVISFGALTTIYYLFARKFRYKFHPFEFFCYYFIFSPLFLFIVAINLLKVCMHSSVEIDWKY